MDNKKPKPKKVNPKRAKEIKSFVKRFYEQYGEAMSELAKDD